MSMISTIESRPIRSFLVKVNQARTFEEIMVDEIIFKITVTNVRYQYRKNGNLNKKPQDHLHDPAARTIPLFINRDRVGNIVDSLAPYACMAWVAAAEELFQAL